MQDGVACHTSKVSLNKIRENFKDVRTNFPGNLLDLNPIENIWSILQDSVFDNPWPKNREQLIARVQEKGNYLTTNELVQYVASFPRCIKDCLDAEGRLIKK